MQKPTLSKTLWARLCALFCLSLLTTGIASAQCDLTNLKHITYDTLIIGTANDEYSINLPQFDPSIGTLASVKLNSTISVNYGYSLQNIDINPVDFTVQMARADNFSSTALSDPYSNEIDTTIGEYLLNPNDQVSKNLYNVLYRYSENDSITDNVAPFLGSNQVSFDYTTLTYANLYGGNQYAFNASAGDTIHFSITYYYCENVILANNLISFSADKGTNNDVKLNWTTTGAQQGINYQIQTGLNENELEGIDSVNGVNNLQQYGYDYKIATHASGVLYFRLKITNASGQIKYSEIKAVDCSSGLGQDQTFVFPNPTSDYININLPKGDWDFKIYSAVGVLVLQNQVTNTSQTRINFGTKLNPGTYFIKAHSVTSNTDKVLTFIVK